MTEKPVSASNIVEVIRYWTDDRPKQEVFRFYPQGEGEFTTHNFIDFKQRCESIAAEIQHLKGKRVILLFHSGIEFLEAFFACLFAGVVAVPAYPPRRNHNLDRLLSIIQSCEPEAILSCTQVLDLAKPLCDETFPDAIKNLEWINTDDIAEDNHSQYSGFTPNEDDIAFLQYTSGSTGEPKGVMVSHKNLMVNTRMSALAFNMPDNARAVSWLPLFHDMGLIGAVMASVYWGTGAILMPPAAFLQKPSRWIQLINEYNQQYPVGTTAPNFAYQLCIDAISDDDVKNMNLQNWVLALNAAEPIRPSTVKDFCEKFSHGGFNPDYYKTSFGMAESTLISTCKLQDELLFKTISGHELAQDRFVESESGNMQFVSSGNNIPPQDIAIVNPESREKCADNHVGEIWLKGDHIAKGYWGKPELSKETFDAFTSCGEGPYMRTGDLGVWSDDNLFVTGRLKDLLIIRGKNHYPQDIELTATQAHESLAMDSAAAVTVQHNGEDKLVLILEVLRTHRKGFDEEAVAQIVKNAVAKNHGIETHAIAFIRFSSIKKTTSGKVQHKACKEAYEKGELTLIGHWQGENDVPVNLPVTPTKAMSELNQEELEAWIVSWLAAKARVTTSEIPLEEPIDGLGLDSVDLVQLSGELEDWLGKPIDNTLVWEQPHIRALSEALLKLAKDSPKQEQSDEIEGYI